MRTRLHLILLFAVVSITGLTHARQPAGPPSPTDSRMAEFDNLFGQRKQLLDELKRLDKQYASAGADKKKAIARQANELFSRLMALHPRLIKLAEEIYVASPKVDPRPESLLKASCEGGFLMGDYEGVFRFAKLLIEHGCQEPKLYLWGGIAAFCVGELDTSEAYLTTAAKKAVSLRSGKGNPLDPTFLRFLRNPREHKEAWKKEQEIRARETKADDLPRVLIKTNRGDMEIELFENEAPNTAANFISLVEKGYYNGLPFHRVLPGFMAQGGDNGRGGPGYTIPCECHRPNYRKHARGSLSMAHGGRDTGSAQFFLTFIPTTHLDGVHTVFGRVVKGMDVLAKIRKRDPEDPDAARIVPDRILEAKVLRKRAHEYVPKKVGQ